MYTTQQYSQNKYICILHVHNNITKGSYVKAVYSQRKHQGLHNNMHLFTLQWTPGHLRNKVKCPVIHLGHYKL